MKDEEKAIWKKALLIKGEASQIDILLEELAELIQAVIKYKRSVMYKKDINIDEKQIILNIAEEIADVEIMLNQMKFNFSFEKQVKTFYDFKFKRFKDRLNKI